MKKNLFLLFALAIVLAFACTKEDIPVPNSPNEPPPPPPPVTAEVTFKYGELPDGCQEIGPVAMGFVDEAGEYLYPSIKGEFQYPEFTHKLPAEVAKAYLGKKIGVYTKIARVYNGLPYPFEVNIVIDPLLEKQEIFIEIPPRGD